MKYCVNCGTQMADDAKFCMSCGTPVGQTGPVNNDNSHNNQNQGGSIFDAITGGINSLAGGTGAVRPPMRKIFGGMFDRHTRAEAEELFAVGTDKTTPKLSAQDVDWPRPWLYSRVLIAFVIAFVLMHIMAKEFGTLVAIPGVMLVGSFAMPFAALIFFYELNMPRNVSFYTVLKVFLVGGCASLMVTIILQELTSFDGQLDYGGAIIVGIVEEIAKALIVYFFLNQEKDAKYASNGLLIGAAVGAGFAAFESAGYAFVFLLEYMDYELMMDVILLRGVLAPGGHVVWAAMSGYAIMMAKGNGPLSASVFGNTNFLKVFWLPITLHAVWDMPIEFGSEHYLVPIALTIAAWVVVLVLVSNCMSQISSDLQAQAAEEAAPELASVE